MTGAVAIEVAPSPALQAQEDGPQRIGLLGGTFDPPHIGHLVLGVTAAEQLGLGRVVFIPAGVPPHKQHGSLSSTTDRLLMTRLAIAGDPCFELSPVEIERPGVSYTVDTVEHLAETYGESVELFVIMAVDSLAHVDTWRDPERILDLAQWAVGPRPGWPMPTREALADRYGARHERIHLFEGPALGISSSDVRARVADRRSIRYLVPRAVEEHIAARGLYRR